MLWGEGGSGAAVDEAAGKRLTGKAGGSSGSENAGRAEQAGAESMGGARQALQNKRGLHAKSRMKKAAV
jgi:hypothetical protein